MRLRPGGQTAYRAASSRALARRRFVWLGAGAALAATVWPAAAQDGPLETWQIYRPDGLGFEIEFPGVPKLETEIEDHGGETHLPIKTIDAEVVFYDDIFSLRHEAYRRAPSLAEESRKLAARL